MSTSKLHAVVSVGEEDEIIEYTHMSTSKLHAVVSVAEQVINLFSISHLTVFSQLIKQVVTSE